MTASTKTHSATVEFSTGDRRTGTSIADTAASKSGPTNGSAGSTLAMLRESKLTWKLGEKPTGKNDFPFQDAAAIGVRSDSALPHAGGSVEKVSFYRDLPKPYTARTRS